VVVVVRVEANDPPSSLVEREAKKVVEVEDEDVEMEEDQAKVMVENNKKQF